MGFIKNWRYPAGKYSVIGVMSESILNKKGENLKELFARRNRLLRTYVRNSRPSMKYSEYFALPTDKKADKFRYDGAIRNDVGGVIERKDGCCLLTLYNLY